VGLGAETSGLTDGEGQTSPSSSDLGPLIRLPLLPKQYYKL